MAAQDSVDGQVATLVCLSYPQDLAEHGKQRIRQDYFKKYLRKVHETATPGDEWLEFTDVGCCGSQMDVPFVVDSVEGGSRITEDTEITYTERDACHVDRWSVQYDDPEPSPST